MEPVPQGEQAPCVLQATYNFPTNRALLNLILSPANDRNKKQTEPLAALHFLPLCMIVTAWAGAVFPGA